MASHVQSLLFDVMSAYPTLSTSISLFILFYFYRSYQAYKVQKKGMSNTSFEVRLMNNVLCIMSIVSLALYPIVLSTTPTIKPFHVMIWSILQVPFYWGTDYFTSPLDVVTHNYKSLLANGFSTARIVIYSFINSFIVWFSLYYFITLMELHGFDQHRHHINMIDLGVKIAINLFASDAFFTALHRKLHLVPQLATIHHMHHACFTCGISASFVFNPIDMILEFGAGILPALCITYLLHGDLFATVLSLAIMVGWYGCDHDENIGSFHAVKHHGNCLGHFPIYFDKKDSIKYDCVRKMLAKGFGYQRS
eukprot:68928_1